MPKAADVELFSREGVEIFAPGTWNGDTYTQKDLEQIAHAFTETKDLLKPFLKLGHNKEQPLLHRDGLPAAGWIERLRVQGGKLVADFVDLPKKIYQLLERRAYKRVSSELLVNYTAKNGKTYPFALKAVSLLGGDTPAVQTLDDILSLYSEDAAGQVEVKTLYSWTSGGESAAESDAVKLYEFETANLKEEVDMKTMEQLQAELTEAQKKYTDTLEQLKALDGKDKQIVELTEKLGAASKRVAELEKANGNLQGEVKKFSEEKNKAEVQSIVDKLVLEKKIVPAQKEMLFAILLNGRSVGLRTYKVGDKDLSEEQVVLNFVNASAPALPTEEAAGGGNPHGKHTSEELEALDSKAKKYAEEHKVSYTEALLAVSPAGVPNAIKAEGK